MTTHRIAGLLCAATLATLTTAQGVHRFALDTVGSVHQIIENGMVTTDGHIVMQLDGPGYDILWKGQLDGTPIWQKRVTPEIERVHALPNGDLMIIHRPIAEVFENLDAPPGMDTIRVHISWEHLGIAGDPLGSSGFRMEQLSSSSVPHHFGRLRSSIDSNGNLFCTVGIEWELWVFKLNAEGQLQWCWKPFEQHSGGLVNWPDLFVEEDPLIMPDNMGGCYLMARHAFNGAHQAMHLDASGDITWAHAINYVNANASLSTQALNVTPGGDLFVLGELYVNANHFNYFVRHAADGSSISADFHYPPAEVALSRNTADGGLLLYGDGRLRELNDDGEVIELLNVNSLQANGSTNFFHPLNVDRVDGHITLPGYMKATHDVFGYQNWFPGAYTVDASALPVTDCLLGPGGPITRIAIPDSMIQVVDLDLLVQAPAFETTPGAAVTIEAVGPIPTRDLCGLLTGVAEGSAGNSPHVTNTLLTTGQDIRLSGGEAFRTTVLDAQGREVDRTRLHATGSTPLIGTRGWPAGTYFVRITNANGMHQRTDRVVVTH